MKKIINKKTIKIQNIVAVLFCIIIVAIIFPVVLLVLIPIAIIGWEPILLSIVEIVDSLKEKNSYGRG